MGLDDVQLGFGDRDALGPVIHDTRMPVLAPAAADRRCASPWARQIIIKVDDIPVARCRTGSCSGVLHAVIVRASCASASSGSASSDRGAAPAANRTALTASPSAQASGRGWID